MQAISTFPTSACRRSAVTTTSRATFRLPYTSRLYGQSLNVASHVACSSADSGLAASSSQPASDGSSTTTPDIKPASVAPPVQPEEKKTAWQRVKGFFGGGGKEKLAALGMGAFASYGVISNVTYGACLTIAWLTFVKSTGKSPLAAGQWQGFLAVYAGLWAIQNFVRPLRFTLAIALAPAFECAIAYIGEKLNVKKQWAFTVLLFAVAITTIAGLVLAIYLGGGFI